MDAYRRDINGQGNPGIAGSVAIRILRRTAHFAISSFSEGLALSFRQLP
jgi:hypothetical protein